MIRLLDRIRWKIGADQHNPDPAGPLREGTVYAIYPKGTHPYWKPFLMVTIDRDETTIESLLNPPHNLAVALSNPTLEVKQ